jgi:hypothetical protein
MKAKELPPLEWLNEWLTYDAEVGKLYWKKQRGSYAKAGSEAGGLHAKGYIRVGIKGNYYQAHRICWTLYHQELIGTEVILDHINGDRGDNRICNLRVVELWQNNHNRRCPNPETKGVHFNPKSSKVKPWKATIKINNTLHYLGTYETQEEAVAARHQAEAELGVAWLRSVTTP